MCFCVFECAGTDIKEMDEKRVKTDKPSTRYGKSVEKRGQDGVKIIFRAHHWKEHEKTSPEVLSDIFEPVQYSLNWQVKIATIRTALVILYK